MAYLKIPKSQKARASVESALKKIMEAFKDGSIVPAMKRMALHRAEVPLDSWSWRNKMMAYIAGTTDGRTLKAWNAAGRKLKRGSSAFYVWEPLKRYGEDKNTGEKFSYLYGFMVSPRFRVEDTEGDPLPENEAHNVEPPPLAEAAEKLGVPVEYSATPDGRVPAWGWYSPGQNRIGLYTDDARVFFHELGHAAHKIVMEKRGKKLVGGQDYKQEAVAELVAATLAEVYGSSTTLGNSYEYIKRYANEKNKDLFELCVSVLSDVEQCIGVILDAAE